MTYADLRDRALKQCSAFGQTEAQAIAEIALEECMKWVSFHVRVPSLIASATATAPADANLEANAITLGVGGFNITSTYSCIDRLYVKKESSVVEIGLPYEYYEYHYFQDLKSIPSNERVGLFTPAVYDERATYSFTITPSAKLWAQPLTENNVLTLVYRKAPAAYSGAATPEILPLFDHILVNGAALAVKEWQREPSELVDYWTLFDKSLSPQVERYNLFLSGQRKRKAVPIHRSYRPY